jgi:hypothetical protein
MGAVMPRTRTLRRDLARTIRGELRSYADLVDDRQDRLLLDVAAEVGMLLRLEGFTHTAALSQLSKGWREGGAR